jgi:hypothetical protein
MIAASLPRPQVFFPITLDSDIGLMTETLLRRDFGASISRIVCEVLPQKHQVRLWVHTRANVYGRIIRALISTLPSAEIGEIKAVSLVPDKSGK